MAEKSPEARLLVVDDEPSIRELLTASLRFARLRGVPGRRRREALKLAEQYRPDLVVLDVMLPDLDGFTVTRRLRERGRDVPVVFLTARDDTSDKVQGLTSAATTTSPSRSASRRSSPASAPCCAAPASAAPPTPAG